MSNHMEPRRFNFAQHVFEDQIEEGKAETIKQLVEDHAEKFCDELKRRGHCDSKDCRKHGWLDSY